jgi:hypothetical protein
MIVEEGEFSVLYECNPEKNEQCNKKSCSINGGPCHQTTNVMYAKDSTKATMVIPMSQEAFDELKNEDGAAIEVSIDVAKPEFPGDLVQLNAPRNRGERRHGRQK